MQRPLRHVALLALIALPFTSSSAPAHAAPPKGKSTLLWRGPTPLQSANAVDDHRHDAARLPGARPAEGTRVEVRSPTKARAVVSDAFGARTITVPGEFVGVGPTRIRVDFARDDFFEAVLALPDAPGEPAETVRVTIPEAKSGALIAGKRRIPVSRGTRVITWRDAPRIDLAAMSGARGQDEMPLFGARYLASGKTGVDIRQLIFDLSATDTVEDFVQHLLDQGLSTHLAIGRDGTLFQLLDLEHNAFHSGEANNSSIGLHLIAAGERFLHAEPMTRERYAAMSEAEAARFCAEATPLERAPLNHGLFLDEGPWQAPRDVTLPASEFPRDPNLGVDDPDQRRHPAPVATIHGFQLHTFGPSRAMTRAVIDASSALLAAFPRIPRTLPVDPGGALLTSDAAAPSDWGIIGSWHRTTDRWTPGAILDWQALANLLITSAR